VSGVRFIGQWVYRHSVLTISSAVLDSSARILGVVLELLALGCWWPFLLMSVLIEGQLGTRDIVCKQSAHPVFLF